MRLDQKHIIRRQIIELELPDQSNAMARQKRFSSLYQEVVLPKLETLFSELVAPEELLSIPKLEIDLGSIEEGKEEVEFVEKCVRAIVKEIRKQFYLSKETQNSEAIFIPKDVAVIDRFSFFLSTGRMKWNIKPTSWNEFEFDILSALEKESDKSTTRVHQQLTSKKTARLRLIKQFSANFLQRFFHLIFKTEKKWMAIIDEYQKLQKETASLFSIETTQALYELILKQVLFFDPQREGLPAQLLAIFARKKQEAISEKQFIESIRKINFDSQKERIKEMSPALKSEKKKSSEEVEDHNASEGIFIENAGLVLLAPFLPALFKELNLLEKEQFKDKEAQHRAILLTQFLVGGIEEYPEYELPFNKILCGLPLNIPLDNFIHLKAKEKKEAYDLLKSVIKHWKALGEVSPESLQQGFLQRTGKLNFEQSKWRLIIERKPIDLLVERLPWTVSIVKTNWMKDRMIVDW